MTYGGEDQTPQGVMAYDGEDQTSQGVMAYDGEDQTPQGVMSHDGEDQTSQGVMAYDGDDTKRKRAGVCTVCTIPRVAVAVYDFYNSQVAQSSSSMSHG